MKIYFAGTRLQGINETVALARTMYQNPPRRTCLLVSYHYYKQESLEQEIQTQFDTTPDIFLDSGAFSAMTQGAKIDLAKYADYLHRYRAFFTVYANLDVIKNAQATWDNQRRMEEQYGLSPLPVFHVGEPWKFLDLYLEKYSYIALGVAGTRLNIYMPWLVKCFKTAGTCAVFHGFGITHWLAMKSFPWYSVDSTSWNRTGRYGCTWVFDEKNMKLQEIRVNGPQHFRKCYEHGHHLRAYGLDPARFAIKHKDNILLGNALAVCALWKAGTHLERWYGDVQIPRKEIVS